MAARSKIKDAKPQVAGGAGATGSADRLDGVTSEYRGEESCRVARAMARLEAADGAIAEALGVAKSTLNAWRLAHREFSDALRTSPDLGEGAISRAVLRSALGYYYQIEKTIRTRAGSIVRKQVRYKQPDQKALRWLLSIRVPEVFGSKRREDMSPNTSALLDAIGRESIEKKYEGRPPIDLPTEDSCRIAKTMTRLGATDEEIADALGIDLPDFESARDADEKFSAALKAGKELLDEALERTAMQCAVGYSYSKDEVFCTRAGDIVRNFELNSLDATEDMWWRSK